MNEHLKKYLDEENRLTAIHEAGHASMFWFFQQRSFLHGISMRSTDEYDAIVMQSSLTAPFEITAIASEHPLRARRLEMMEVMHCFAGPFAEACYGSEDWRLNDYYWLEQLFDEYDWFGSRLVDIIDNGSKDDFSMAVRKVSQLFDDENKVHRFLITGAKWTEEAFQLAGMSDVVNTLAEKLSALRGSGREEMTGTTVWASMEDTWGKGRDAPILCAPWKGRFSVLKGERWWMKTHRN